MRYDQFEDMTHEEAKLLLEELLDRGASVLEAEKIDPSTTLADLPEVLLKIAARLETKPLPYEPDLPEYIRKTEDYQKGHFQFTDESFRLIIGCAYLLGRSFISEFPQLHWGTGDPEFATGNMPVVKGFRNVQELPPLQVATTLFRRYTKDSTLSSIFAKCIDSWKGSI